MRDRWRALDLDLAVAERARQEEDEQIAALAQDEDGGFFTVVTYCLRRLLG